MKKTLTTILLTMLAVTLLAVPARRITQTITLEDGTTVTAQCVGDEFGHWYVDASGTHYVAQTDGTYRRLTASEFADKKAIVDSKRIARDSRNIQVAARRVQAAGPSHVPAINTAPRGLLILANFTDATFQASNTQAEMDSMLNAQNYNYDLSIGSARKYFYDQSGGRYNPQFDVVGPVNLPHDMAYYGANDSVDQDVMPGDLVLHACSIASQIPGVNFANYDNDNDGWLDFVYIIYAGYGEADSYGNLPNTMWPASWDLPSAIYFGNCSITDYNETDSYTFDGKAIGSFAYSSELSYYSTYSYLRGFSPSHPMRNGIGTFCHEFSHVIGLPDYYDTEYQTNYDANLTPGNWSLMDGGSYNEDGEVPPAFSIYDKYFVGWATPTLLNEPQVISLQADGFSGYYITSNGSAATPTTSRTVYYLENRQQEGWDKGIPGHGMLAWKVDYDEGKWVDNTVNNTANSPNLIFIPADGTYTKNSYTGMQGDDGDPYPGSAGITEFTPFADYPLTEITETNGIIAFSFMGGQPCEGFSVAFEGFKSALLADSTACILSGNAWSGTVTAQRRFKLVSVTVSMGGEILPDAAVFAGDSLSADILISQVTGEISIIAQAQRIRPEGENICDDYFWQAENALQIGNYNLGDMLWMITAGINYPYTGFDESRGAQIGSGNKPARRVSLTTIETANCMVDEITVNASKGNGGDATLSIYIHGQQVGETVNLQSVAADYTFINEANLQGTLELRFQNTNKAIFIKSIEIYHKEGMEIPDRLVEKNTIGSATKVLRDGKIYIMRDNIEYDILGNICR